MKVLFLDIDGVMNNQNMFLAYGVASDDPDATFDRDPIGNKHLDLLKQIIDATGAEIVLSSSWRLSEDLLTKVVTELARKEMQLLDTTENLGQFPRCVEIDEWLSRHVVEQFVILDDNGDAEIEGHFLQTSFAEGLTPEIAQRTIEKLNELGTSQREAG